MMYLIVCGQCTECKQLIEWMCMNIEASIVEDHIQVLPLLTGHVEGECRKQDEVKEALLEFERRVNSEKKNEASELLAGTIQHQREFLARVAHEINRQICILNGEQALHYSDMPRDIIESMEKTILEMGSGSLGDSHREWMKVREGQGWVYGPTKCMECKTSPCLVPFEELPYQQKVKDCIFVGIKNAVHGWEKNNEKV